MATSKTQRSKQAPVQTRSGVSYWLFGVIGFAVACGALVAFWPASKPGVDEVEKTERDKPPTTRVIAPAKPARVDTQREPARIVARSAVARYDLVFEFTSTQRNDPFVDLSLRGQLQLRPGKFEKPTAALPARLVSSAYVGELQLRQAGNAVPDETHADVLSGLETPFFVTYSESGQVDGLRFAPDTIRVSQTTLRSVMTTAQIVGANTEQASWDVEETDSNGRYLARYETAPPVDGDPEGLRRLKKKKLTYKDSFGGATHSILNSEATLSLLGDELREFEVVERIRVTSSNAAATDIEATTRMTLSYAGSDPASSTNVAPELLAEAFSAAQLLRLEESGTKQARQHELDTAIVQGQRFDQVMIGLRQTGDDRKTKQAKVQAYRQLTSMVRLDPARAQKLAEWVKAGDPLSTSFIAALGDASTPQSQTALIGLFKDASLPNEAKLEVLRSVSLLATPTPEASQFLRELSTEEPYAEQAIYGIGSHAHQTAAMGNDPKPLVDELVSGLKGSDDPRDQSRYLTGLGNAGDPETLDVLSEALEQVPSSVKPDAAHAFRRIPGDDADAILIRLLLEHENPDVRVQAARAIREREQTAALAAALAKALRTELVGVVKNTLIQVSALWASNSEEIRQALTWLAANEQNETLRQQAQIVLESLGPQP